MSSISSGIYFTPEEQELMDAAPSTAERLYRQIRKSMTYTTGFCGVATRISWEGLAARISKPGRPGISAENYSVQQTKRSAKHLERLGLISNHSNPVKRQLILKCELAKLGRIEDQKEAEKQTQKIDRKPTAKPTANPDPKPTGTDFRQPPMNTGILELDIDKNDRIPGRIPDRFSVEKPDNIRVSEYYCTVPNGAPNSPMQIVDYFVTKRGFQIHRAQTVQTIPLFAHWVEKGVTYDDIEQAAAIAEVKIGGKPDSPIFYKRFIQQYLLEKERAAIEAATPPPAYIPDGGQQYAKRKPVNRKPLSAVERVAAANKIDSSTGQFYDDHYLA